MKVHFKIIPLLFTLLLTTSCSPDEIKVNPNKEKYVVGISQFVRHEALDAATKGFKDSLKELLNKEGREVEFLENNAQGDTINSIIIANSYVSRGVDLIMANATAPLQSAYNSTMSIPILGTSITEYGTALGIKDFKGITNDNVSGTSDLAPLETQASMIKELLPSVKKVGLLYCSSEANSKYQVEQMEIYLKNIDIETKRFSFTDSTDIYSVALAASNYSDCIYVPTDNQVASNANLIKSAAIREEKKTPIFCGEEGPCKICGFATLSISYYELGKVTGEMAYEVLLGKTNIKEMAIRYASNPKKKYNKEICEELGITVDDSFIPIGTN